jgi:hypothetical protein
MTPPCGGGVPCGDEVGVFENDNVVGIFRITRLRFFGKASRMTRRALLMATGMR